MKSWKLMAGALSAALIGTAVFAAGPLAADQGGTRIYEVTIKNLATGQPFSPPLLATHGKDVDVFSVGNAATAGVQAIAEDGNNAVLAAALGGLGSVHDVVASATPIFRAGQAGSSLTLTIEARGNADHLSLVTMLICTNDGFSGLDGVKLPGGFHPVTYLTTAYDGGTEANDELYTHIVDPCGAIGPVMVAPDGMNLRTGTAGNIAMHPGLTGAGDLTAAHSWTNPVLEITVRRVK